MIEYIIFFKLLEADTEKEARYRRVKAKNCYFAVESLIKDKKFKKYSIIISLVETVN